MATTNLSVKTLPGFDSLLSLLRNNCLVLSNSSGLAGATEKTGEALLTVLANVTAVLQLQSNGQGGNSVDWFCVMMFAGFGFAILLSYKSLQTSVGLQTNSSEQLSSRVVTVSVSNPNTTNLSEPIILTFNHLKSSDANTTCVYWSEDGEGAWSIQGCTSVKSNSTHTVCSCTHLSSFALLRGIQENKVIHNNTVELLRGKRV
ncbi:adhesion G protein-coupled receptor E2-like [Salvelinus fontinalis]|uniref:adhesion G protein-coupled receptor E2-like n=1 Tax=Salvelinus fontinalis TaxID=8038 RepID=UPI002485B516|nr:adhesion G protein-coupled receptor E2-like [Salvelinus fontinalis]